MPFTSSIKNHVRSLYARDSPSTGKRSAIEFQQHALEQSHHNEPEIHTETSSKDNKNLTFSQAKGSANAGNNIPIPAMKMKEAWLCHIPLGYSSLHKPSEDPNSILEGDNDDIKESADDILAP
nr:8286_t:CDS:2 [Entrophospora candida]CAG8600120.1 10533_t:CDS:2 [Entrophospora candida]